MADRYLLESGAPDGYLLEDGSGVLLLEDVVASSPFKQILTQPQQCTDRTVAGYGLIMIASAIIASFSPPVDAVEYQYGTHQAAIHDKGIRGSVTFRYPHEEEVVVASHPIGSIKTLPQLPSIVQGQIYNTPIWQFIAPPNRPDTWVDPQQYGVQQGTVNHTLIQQFINPPNKAKTFTLPQPFDVQQGNVYHTLIQQFIVPPNYARTFTLPQPFDIQQGFVYHTLIQQFIAPPNRLAFVTNPQAPQQVYSSLFKAWEYVTVQDPPLRTSIGTVAELPQNVPSSVKGDVAQFAPEQPKPVVHKFEFGSHEAVIRQRDNRSVVWYKPPTSVAIESPLNRPYITTQAEIPRLAPSSFKIVTPWLPPAPLAINYPPVNPRYQYGTHQLHHLQSSNRISLVIPWQINLYEAYFISLDTIGERDEDFSIRPSYVFMPQIAEGAPYVPPKDRPVVVQVRPQSYENQQSQIYTVHLDARVETLAIRDQTNFTLPQTYQVRNDSKVFVHPPKTVTSPRKYRSIETVPQPTQLYDINRSKVSARNAAQLPSIPVTDVYEDLVGMEINIYQGIVLPEVIRHMGRVVTEPKLIGAIAQLEPPFDFSRGLEAGETLLTASVIATVYSGVDPNPSAIRSGSPVINGNKVEQMMKGGVLGCVYELLCTASTSMGQTLQLSTYFYVEPNLP